MNAHEAASMLGEFLRGIPGIHSIGVGQHDGDSAIFVYTSRSVIRELDEIGGHWKGFPIVVRRTGRIAPLTR